MKKRFILALAMVMLLSLAGCGSDTDAESKGGDQAVSGQTTESSSNEDNANTNEPATPEFSLDTTEVRVLCAEDGYMALALFHCPTTDYGLRVCDESGNSLNVYMYDRYRGLTAKDGVWLADTEDWSGDKSSGEINVVVTDASGAERLFTNIAPITQEEITEAGLFCIDGYGTFAAVGDIYSNSSSVEFNVVVYMFCKDGINSIENGAERFQFYAEDGTPLAALFPEYDFTVDVRAPYVNAVFKGFEDADTLTKQLQNCNPYMVYTGTDGTTWTLPLIKS